MAATRAASPFSFTATGAAAHEHVGASRSEALDRCLGHAAVDLDQERIVADRARHLGDGRNLLLATLNVALPGKARLDAHHEHHIEARDDLLEHLGGRVGLERHGGLRTRVVDHVDRTAQLVAIEHLGVVDHEMHVERDVRQLRELLHHGNAHGEVGNEMPVHHVDVDIARARLLDHADISAEVHEVSRKN